MSRSTFTAFLTMIFLGAASVFSQQASVATVVNFDYTNGALPYAGMTLGSDGNLYGTAGEGGTNFGGVIFELSSNNTFTLMAEFAGSNGSFCPNPMILASNGNLYGVTYVGGTNGTGSIFEFTTNHSLISLVSLGGTNGSEPWGSLVQASDGNFYGTTSSGGPAFSNGFGGAGTIFMMKPDGTFSNLYNFTGGNDGSVPYSALVEGTNHVLYGTTYGGGSSSNGVIFGWKIDPGEMTVLPFGGSIGSSPGIGMILGCNGLMVGATSIGGPGGGGVVFQFDYNAVQLTSLHNFTGIGSDGETPFGPLVMRGQMVYGTTYEGGLYNFGTIYKLRFDKGKYDFSTVYSFHDGLDGGYPESNVSFSRFGSLYVTTKESSGGYGTIDELFNSPRLWRPTLVNSYLSVQCTEALPGFAYQPMYSWTAQPGAWANWGNPIVPTTDQFTFGGTVSAPQGFVQFNVTSPYPVTQSPPPPP